MKKTNKYIKICPNSFVIRETQVNTEGGSNSHIPEWQKVKSQPTLSNSENIETSDHFDTAAGDGLE